MAEIDFSSEFGKRALKRLESEVVVWLTTVSAKGTPQPSPVWFLWENGTILLFSQPNTPKLRAIAQNSRVSLNFNSTETGGDVVVFSGTAEIVDSEPPAHENPAYRERYRESIGHLGMTPESFAGEYSVTVRVTPTSLRGF